MKFWRGTLDDWTVGNSLIILYIYYDNKLVDNELIWIKEIAVCIKIYGKVCGATIDGIDAELCAWWCIIVWT